jgi:RNA polymerase sigma factor (sigma-70 family)
MSKLSENLPPDIAALFDKPGCAWSPEERHRVWRWLAEDPQKARLQDIAQKHLRRPQSMQATDMAKDVVQAYLTKSFDNLCNQYDPCPAEFLVKHVRDFGRLLDKLCQPPEALAVFLREHLQEATRQVLDQQWPPLRDAVTTDLNRVLDEPSLYTVERFATVQLQDETRQLLTPGEALPDPRRLNLMLLRDAYPTIFLRSTAELRVKDFGRLLNKLHQPPKAEALAAFLKERLQEGTRQALMQWPPLRDIVVADLNHVLDEPSFYTAERFATVKLQDKTRKFLSQHMTDANPRRLNRMLLTDAYQGCLLPARDFLGYILACLQRYCHQVKLPPEMPATMVETYGAEGNIYMHPERAEGNIYMHPERAAELNEFITKFGDALAALPLEDRRLMLMHYFLHMSLAECAAAFGISEGNAKVRLFRARLKLARILLHDAYFQDLKTDADFWRRFYAYGYWKPFSDAIMRRFASELPVPQQGSEDAASEDGQDDDGVL